MKRNMIKLAAGAAALLMVATSADAKSLVLKTDKVTLKPNMIVKYNKTPKAVDSIGEAFTEGMFYGRLRTNFFLWDWANKSDNRNNGIGGMFMYKTAPVSGFSATAAMYTSQSLSAYRMSESDVGSSKSGKDTFSRDKVNKGAGYGLSVLGQAYLQYDLGKTSIVAGRQLFETLLTKSNDTKMIPNTFDGISATIKDLPKTTIKLAYFAKQKLRDHEDSHDVLAYDNTTDANGFANKWKGNDDSAINKSLNVDLIGNDNKLIVVGAGTKIIPNLKAMVHYTAVPGVLTNISADLHYTIPVGGVKIIPGMRYMKQMDNLGASVNVASLKGQANSNVDGYKGDTTSLDSGLFAARVDIKTGGFMARLGYSKIEDAADIVAPWRGFPTGGYTRAMAQYNWFANTETIMLRLQYDFDDKILPGFSMMGRYAIQDFDDAKDAVAADSTVIHVDLRQKIGESSQLKFRLGIVTADANTVKVNQGGLKTDYSYNEYRLEYNYFF